VTPVTRTPQRSSRNRAAPRGRFSVRRLERASLNAVRGSPRAREPRELGGFVDLMEYQAKELFAKHGVATTLGEVVETAEDAKAAAEKIGGVTVVKAQVKAGGRGKAGGVKIAKNADEAYEYAKAI